MSRALATCISGMGLSGAFLVNSVPALFNSPIENRWKIVAISSTITFIIFTISAMILRKKIDHC